MKTNHLIKSAAWETSPITRMQGIALTMAWHEPWGGASMLLHFGNGEVALAAHWIRQLVSEQPERHAAL